MGPNLSSTLEPEMAAGPSRTLGLTSRYIRFGPFQVDQQRQEVSKNGVRLKLQGKVYQVLLALIEKHGEVVTREELRQALGDSSDKPQYIETIPRKGYCLIVSSEFADVPAAVTPVAATNGLNGTAHSASGATKPPKSDVWITLGVIGLIIAGMLLGAGITKLWIYHFVSPPGGPWF